MIIRKIDRYLVDWTMRKKKKSLIIEGPRLVGKTTSIKNFINTTYDDNCSVYVSFKENPTLVRIFNKGLEVSRLYQELKIRFPNTIFEPGKTVIFFDDIQLCPSIISYLRKFTDDGLYDIISAGSSLGAIYKKYPLPIGYVERYNLGPIDFEEYLWANGFDEERLNYLEELYLKHDFKASASHDVLLDLFREYMVIGGMPNVVSEYLKEHNFKLAYDLQREIIDVIYEEIDIHTSKAFARKTHEVFDSLPRQLSKENKKFQYRFIHEKARATSHKKSVEWLLDTELTHKSNNLQKPIQPFVDYLREDTYKMYLFDTGLLVCMFGEETQLKILRGDIMVHNGAVLENVMASILYMNGFNLYYYENNSTIDVDFLIMRNRKVTPVLCKQADNPKSKIMKVMNDKFNIKNGIKFSQFDHVVISNIEIIPLYMSVFLER